VEHLGSGIERHGARHVRGKRHRHRAGAAADVEQPLVGHRLHALEQREPRRALDVRLAHRVLARVGAELARGLAR
jgi:hypothetical protein